uniref:Uncharacterized protein n=1 Tax=Panagrolaimus superbus TaxID=310955 RepID=A0A914YRG9_9BILA
MVTMRKYMKGNGLLEFVAEFLLNMKTFKFTYEQYSMEFYNLLPQELHWAFSKVMFQEIGKLPFHIVVTKLSKVIATASDQILIQNLMQRYVPHVFKERTTVRNLIKELSSLFIKKPSQNRRSKLQFCTLNKRKAGDMIDPDN